CRSGLPTPWRDSRAGCWHSALKRLVFQVPGGARKPAMRIERSATSISWIPSDSIPGLLRLPFARGIMHYDPPPPPTLTDVEGMRRRGEFRFANLLSAYIDVDDGRITGAGYTGGTTMGLTPVTAGPLRVMLPTKANRDIQWKPALTGDQATFVQTSGG